ncbi:MAG TPA: DUF4870 domain-containing protein [Opitutaceae bacterium]|nr:DUF4870 domain-containing protein [Opitutaceae bacterium]
MSDTPVHPSAPAAAAGEDKTVAIVAYLTLIGWIVALVLQQSKKSKLGAFHLRQALGLGLTLFVGGFLAIIPILGWIAFFVIWVGVVVFAIMGFISAINGQAKPVPVLGEKYQKWFGTAFD